MRIINRFIPFILMLLLAGCSYKFAGSGRLPDGVENLYVNAFTNRSSESGWETRFANELITDLSKSGIRTISSKAAAQSFFHGRIVSITFDTLTSAGASSQGEVRVRVTVDASVTARDGTLLWEKKGLVRSTVYSESESAGKDNALQELAEDFSVYIISLLTENF